MNCFQVYNLNVFNSSGDVPFIVPPRFKRASQKKEKRDGREDTEEWEHHPDLHTQRGSLTVGSMSLENKAQNDLENSFTSFILSSLCRSWGWFPLGRLRPDLYQLPEEPGEWALPNGTVVRLWFALRYQDEREQLVVSLLRAANLPSWCQGNITLVKLQLLPSEERRHRQAKAKRKGRHPTFNDSFVFQVVEQIFLSFKVQIKF